MERRSVRFLAANRKSFIDEYSDQPAAEGAVILEPRWIARRCKPTVPDGFMCGFGAT
jgi:hypothetical protein